MPRKSFKLLLSVEIELSKVEDVGILVKSLGFYSKMQRDPFAFYYRNPVISLKSQRPQLWRARSQRSEGV